MSAECALRFLPAWPQVALEQYFIDRGEFRPFSHLQYYTGYRLSGAEYVPIDRLLKVSCAGLLHYVWLQRMHQAT
jgi:hypothetical protein